MQGHATTRRRNRVYKSLHKPLTYLGVERTLFFFVCVAAVGAFNLFNSLLAGIAVLCIWPLGHECRPCISAHPRTIRTIQDSL
jgi:hypothetical protein